MTPSLRAAFVAIFIAVTATTSSAVAQTSEPAQTSSQRPAPFVYTKTLGNCPASLDWQSLRGSVVVITRMDGLPGADEDHQGEWHQLFEKVSSERIIFIALFPGSVFLAQEWKQPLPNFCFVLDPDEKNAAALGFTTRVAASLVIDAYGYKAGYMRERTLSVQERADAIVAVAHGVASRNLSEKIAQPRTNPQPDLSQFPAAPSYDVVIKPADPSKPRALGVLSNFVNGQFTDANRYLSLGQPIKNLIFDAWEVMPTRIVYEVDLDNTEYDVMAFIPVLDHAVLHKTVQDALQSYFGLQIQKEKRLQKIYRMRSSDAASTNIEPAQPGEREESGGGDDSIDGVAQSSKDIARALEDIAGVPVIDETGWTGKFDYSVTSRLPRRSQTSNSSGDGAPSPEQAIDFADQLGLQLIPDEQLMDMLVVRKVR